MLSTRATTLAVMMLVEPGSRVDGDTTEVLRSIYQTTVELLEETMSIRDADELALRHLARVHADLAAAGLVTRQL